MSLFLQWIISAVAIIITAFLVPGVTTTFVGALIFAVVLALINIFIRPFIVLLTLPLNILTLGLFTLVINALIVWLAAKIVPGFSVSGFWSAFIFAIVLFFVNAILFYIF